VKPLRDVRRLLKELSPASSDATRRRVADAELAAEHAEQLKLVGLYSPPADRDRPVEKRLRAAIGNLGVYAVCLGVVPDDADRRAAAALLRGAFSALPATEIAEAVGVTPSA
jgi:hypothetical protein